MQIKIDNGFITYNQVGKGIPILFIHGYPLSRKMWQPQTDALSDIASSITLDLRGHGESFPFEPPYPMDLLAEDCKRVLDQQNITEPVVVCGMSMGGYVTFALYRKYPQLFRGMILTSTRAAADSPEGKAGREAAIKNVQEHDVPFMVENMLPKTVSPRTYASNPKLMDAIRDIMLETSVQGVIGASQGMRDRPDSIPLLSQVNVPVLIIYGADDQIIPMSEAEAMHHRIRGSLLVVIPQAGHLANMEQPGLFNQAIRTFLKTLH